MRCNPFVRTDTVADIEGLGHLRLIIRSMPDAKQRKPGEWTCRLASHIHQQDTGRVRLILEPTYTTLVEIYTGLPTAVDKSYLNLHIGLTIRANGTPNILSS